jgi:ribonucleoside-diphosphate reductase alpha chain
MAKRDNLKIELVVKNDGSEEAFDWKKLERSVVLAGRDTKAFKRKEAEKVLESIKRDLGKVKTEKISTNEIRDIVEPALAEAGYFKTAKYYILFREKKQQEKLHEVEIKELELMDMGRAIAEKRYLHKDLKGKVIETPGEMFWRVAQHMAKAEIQWTNNGEVKEMAKKFYDRLVNFKFVSAGRAMYESGNPQGTGQLSSCFVLGIEDSIFSIFKTLGEAALLHKNNGGTGFNFSKIRPRGDKVKNVPGAASGPVDFLRAFSAALAQILQGSKRQGANIAILNVDHPDIEEFIHLKDEDGTIKNFNISVGVTNEFMEAVERDEMWKLKNPRNGEVWKKMKARKLFDEITEHAWISGDPGLAFLDRMEEDNPTPTIAKLDATNPCGEIPLLPYESCNLTSICLHRHLCKVKNKSENEKSKEVFEIDWEDLEKSVRLGIRFLDNMIEVNTYALPEIEQMVKYGNRRIGLGVMGFAHMLYMMGIPYNSVEAVRLSNRLAKFIHKIAESESLELAKVRGTFPNWDISVYSGTSERYRNCALTMVAPTGTISLLANTSSGIEPVFSLVTLRKVFNEEDKKNRPTKEFMIIDPIFEQELKRIWNNETRIMNKGMRLKSVDEVLAVVAEEGLGVVEGLPKEFYKIFVTTHEIGPSWHIKIQAAWQKWFDNSISKTINFPHNAEVEDVREAYLQAWRLGCKGITIYRDGSKQDQVLNLAKSGNKNEISNISIRQAQDRQIKDKKEAADVANGIVDIDGNGSGEYESGKENMLEQARILHAAVHVSKLNAGESTMCPECGAEAAYADGCATCVQCGWSKCSM